MNFTVCVRIRPSRIHTIFHSRFFFYFCSFFCICRRGCYVSLYAPHTGITVSGSLVRDTRTICLSIATRSKKKHQQETRIEGRGNSCKTFFSQQSIKCHQKKLVIALRLDRGDGDGFHTKSFREMVFSEFGICCQKSGKKLFSLPPTCFEGNSSTF